MIALSSTDARAQWAEVIDRVRVGGDRVVVQKNGRRMVAVISIEDLDALERFEDAADRREAGAAIARNDFIPWDKVRAKLGKQTKKAKSRAGRAPTGRAKR